MINRFVLFPLNGLDFFKYSFRTKLHITSYREDKQKFVGLFLPALDCFNNPLY